MFTRAIIKAFSSYRFVDLIGMFDVIPSIITKILGRTSPVNARKAIGTLIRIITVVKKFTDY